ncbi:MAG: LysR family transcriptional regulator [Oscillibacter sp.]|jgi:DNA-binding transcriptional LysR family regulator|uniref:LysR family transcriptional regulator n=1 Tax=uncultured Oscillibacter sp. TaxID=876091 RepID=UPI002173AFB8|nr:LysR family transcriptional regulator [uncultured Oscillibacter sp.]MCI9644837.1 LysR family transcriptional regulator [Oscillibacter sp.]
MTFQQLTYVVEISKCGSINKAANKLFLSQSGISTAIRELEEELGIQFFVRSNRGVEFTPDGREFLGYAASLLEQKQWIESRYGEARNAAPATHLSVSSQRYPFTEDAFIELLQAPEASRYQFSVREVDMDAVIDDVYDHRADIGVICLTELTEKIIFRFLDSRALVFHEIAVVDPCVYVRRGHPLAEKTAVREADLAGYPYVSFEREQGVAVDFSEEYRMLSLKKPARHIRVNSRSAMLRVLSYTDGFTTGSGLITKSGGYRKIITLPLAEKSGIRIGWIALKGGKLSAQAEQFLALLKKNILESILFTNEARQFRKEEAE